MYYKLYIVFILIIFLFSCSEKKEKDFTQIIELQKKIRKQQNDSTLIYLNQTKSLIDEFKQAPDSLKAENNYLFGRFYKTTNLTLAYNYYNQAINFSKDSISNRENLYFLVLSNLYIDHGDYLNGLSVLDRLESKTYNNASLAEIYNSKQDIYKLLKNYKKSLFFNKKAIKYYRLDKDESAFARSLVWQANLNYYNFNNKQKAYSLLDSIFAMNIKPKKEDDFLKNQAYLSYGIFKYYDKDFKSSFHHYNKAIGFLKNPKTKIDSLNLANSYANIAEVCLTLKNYSAANKYNDSVALLHTVLDENLKSFHLKNKLRLSYETRIGFDNISSDLSKLTSLMNINYEKRISSELTALKESNKKEKELLVTNQKVILNNAKLKRKQILLFSTVGLLLLSGLIGFLFYRQKKLKQEKEDVFMQQRLFRAQMNPHFTSNVLYTIQDLILENKEKANKYLIKFSRLLRLNLENSMQNYTLIEKEMEILSKYLDLQQLRFPDKFTYKINTYDLDVDLLSIPPMLIQPFVENAIEHAFKNIDYKGTITINLSEKENYIYCEIIDNGSGLQTTNSKKNHRSASTSLIKDLLNKMTKKEVVFTNNINSKGLKVSFYIPFSEE